MSTAVGLEIDRRQAEQKAMDQIADRMRERFPQLPTAAILDAIHARYSQFDHSRIRDFVPVLVERAVRTDLSRS